MKTAKKLADGAFDIYENGKRLGHIDTAPGLSDAEAVALYEECFAAMDEQKAHEAEEVTVCSGCLSRACWDGDLFCSGHRHAGSLTLTRLALKEKMLARQKRNIK